MHYTILESEFSRRPLVSLLEIMMRDKVARARLRKRLETRAKKPGPDGDVCKALLLVNEAGVEAVDHIYALEARAEELERRIATLERITARREKRK